MIPAEDILIDGDTAWWIADGPLRDSRYSSRRFIDDFDHPCMTCGGETNLTAADGETFVDCPDCIDGRRALEIEVECSFCRGGAWDSHCYKGTRTLTVSVVPGMVLPIMEIIPSQESWVEPWQAIVGVPGLFSLYSWPGYGSAHGDWVRLPSSARPGRWAVQLKVAS